MKKRRTLDLPNPSKGVAQLMFTMDSKSIAILTHNPDAMLYIMVLDKMGTIIEGRPSSNNNRGLAEKIACNPQDTALVAVGGDKLLMLLSKSEKGFSLANNIKINFQVTCMAFLSMDILMVGTSDDELITIENGEIKFRQQAHNAEGFDLMQDQEQLDRELEQKLFDEEKMLNKRVICMTAFGKGFAFAIFNKVYVFEKVSKFKFERKTILTVPVGIYPESLYQITNLAIDNKQETVIVTCKHSQIYVGILIVPESLKAKQMKFQPLGPLIHIDDILDVSVCSWKPIIMTACKYLNNFMQ